MKVEVTDSGTWRKTLSIEVPHEDVQERLSRAYRDYSKTLNLPGFRKGKVPLSVVKSRFGPAIREEVLAKAEEDFYREASASEGIQPVSAATIEEASFEDGEPLRFKASVDVKPQIEARNYKKLKVTRPVYKVEQAMIDDQLDRLRDQNATEKTVERGAELGDVILADLDELDEAGEPMPGRRQQDRPFAIGGPQANPDLDNQLVGIKAGETRDVTLTHTHDEEDGGTHEHTVRFRVQAKEIRERELPELDDEFAKDLGPFESLEALKERISTDLQAQADGASRSRLVENVTEELIKQNEFDVPESMVENYLESTLENLKREQPDRHIDESLFRQEARAGAERGVKRYLLLEAIADQEAIEVSEEDLDKHLETMSERHNIEGARIRQILGRSGQLERIKSDLLDEKVYDFLIEQATVKDVEEKPEHDHDHGHAH